MTTFLAATGVLTEKYNFSAGVCLDWSTDLDAKVWTFEAHEPLDMILDVTFEGNSRDNDNIWANFTVIGIYGLFSILFFLIWVLCLFPGKTLPMKPKFNICSLCLSFACPFFAFASCQFQGGQGGGGQEQKDKEDDMEEDEEEDKKEDEEEDKKENNKEEDKEEGNEEKVKKQKNKRAFSVFELNKDKEKIPTTLTWKLLLTISILYLIPSLQFTLSSNHGL